MLQLFQPRPDLRAAHVFADHLEATLDLAEELELLHLIPDEHERAPGRDVLAGLDRIGAFVERAEAMELAIAAKLDLARAAASRIAHADARLSTFTKMFHAGTQPLVDLWPALADPGKRIFDSGHDPLTFLQARGVIDESRTSLEGQKYFGTGADYRLLGTVKLADFIELCDTCLRAIDRHYHIYEDDAGWEADRARTLDSLREHRDEAIRVALGAAPAVISAPVEIVASDALDEAIELIEALTFPEAKRFQPDHPLVEEAIDLEETPYALGPETVTESQQSEIVEEIFVALREALTPFRASPVEQDMPVDLTAEAVIDEPQPEASAVAEVAAVGPAAKPGLFAPVAAAGRSLAAILARRKANATAVEAPQALESAAAPEAEASPVDATHSLAQSTDLVAATLDGLEPMTAGMPTAASIEVEAPIADAAAAAHAVTRQLTAVRQRLVDVIAARVRTEPSLSVSEPPTAAPVLFAGDTLGLDGTEHQDAGEHVAATSITELLARTFEIEPDMTPIVLPALDEAPSVQTVSEVELPAVETETAADAVRALDDAGPVSSETEDSAPEIVIASAEVTDVPAITIGDLAPDLAARADIPERIEETPVTSTTEAIAGPVFPDDPEPVRRKRPRRKSRRKPTPRKRRTKRA